MIVGTPGGSTIITSVLQTIVNVIEFDLDLVERRSQLSLSSSMETRICIS